MILLSSSPVRSVPGWPLSRYSRSRPCTGAWRMVGGARWRPHPSLPEGWLHSPKEQRAEGGQEECSGHQACTPQEHVVCRWKQLASEYTVHLSLIFHSTHHLFTLLLHSNSKRTFLSELYPTCTLLSISCFLSSKTFFILFFSLHPNPLFLFSSFFLPSTVTPCLFSLLCCSSCHLLASLSCWKSL